ncbi:hypothetical protein ElyMa_002513300 [Elysia marginata]|uniref:Uncharacterized protein n=1 Tax=Elysia marginata TaxID=1093978 RepID=A0AAV4GR49_9GAST|nr:hypothetical protein ElyMa_002513300 [Elysia marginata]
MRNQDSNPGPPGPKAECHEMEKHDRENVFYVLKASLSTLHNIARCTGVKYYFKEIKTAEADSSQISPWTSIRLFFHKTDQVVDARRSCVSHQCPHNFVAFGLLRLRVPWVESHSNSVWVLDDNLKHNIY